MRRFGLLVGALLLGVPIAARAQGMGMRMGGGNSDSAATPANSATAPATDSAAPAKPITLADLVGTWKGGPADAKGNILAGKDSSMTLTMKSDSTYTWTGLSSQICMSKPNGKWKRLSGTNISWCGGPGYNLKLEGNKLFMTSKQAQMGKRSYILFTKAN